MASSTRRRVSAETSERPLITFETVGTDTPVASAMSAIVVGVVAEVLVERIDEAIARECSHPTTPAKVSMTARDASRRSRREGLTLAIGRAYSGPAETIECSLATFEREERTRARTRRSGQT